MKKLMLLFTVIFAFSLAGCGTANSNVVHQEGNLIVTNYSDHEVTDITVIQSGRVIAVSPEAIENTQMCYFKMEPDSSCVYTVSFVDSSGEEHCREFTDEFTENNPILLAIRYDNNVWTIDYDS